MLLAVHWLELIRSLKSTHLVQLSALLGTEDTEAQREVCVQFPCGAPASLAAGAFCPAAPTWGSPVMGGPEAAVQLRPQETFALGLAQAGGIWMLLQPAGGMLCSGVAPFPGEGGRW